MDGLWIGTDGRGAKPVADGAGGLLLGFEVRRL